jgi:hypothetical protein
MATLNILSYKQSNKGGQTILNIETIVITYMERAITAIIPGNLYHTIRNIMICWDQNVKKKGIEVSILIKNW